MISGIYPFEEIIEDVITETGITNLRNRHPEIIKLIARAEREINPFATLLIRKKMLFISGNGNFDGKSIKKPADFVYVDKVGCCEDGLCDGAYFENVSHIVICDNKPRTEIRFTYWALQHDGRGYPVVSMNHADAVVAYIIWKTYSSKVYSGEGSMQNQMLYERQFEERCGEARGEDFFPSENTMRNIGNMSRWSSFELDKKTSYDRCLSCDNCLTEILDAMPTPPDPPLTKIYYWQQTNPIVSFESIKATVNPTFIQEKESETLPTFAAGHLVVCPSVGRLSFAVYQTPFVEFKIFDALFSTDITDEFDTHFFVEHNIILFVSKNPYSVSNINIKIVQS